MSENYRLIKSYKECSLKEGQVVRFNEKKEMWEDIESGRLIDEDLECNKNTKYWKLVRPDYFKDILKASGKTEEEILPYKDPKDKKQRRLNNIAKIQLAEEFYAQNWIIDWNNTNQRKYYPYFRKVSGSWVVCDCRYGGGGSCGSLAYFETVEKALDAGNKLLDIYSDIFENE